MYIWLEITSTRSSASGWLLVEQDLFFLGRCWRRYWRDVSSVMAGGWMVNESRSRTPCPFILGRRTEWRTVPRSRRLQRVLYAVRAWLWKSRKYEAPLVVEDWNYSSTRRENRDGRDLTTPTLRVCGSMSRQGQTHHSLFCILFLYAQLVCDMWRKFTNFLSVLLVTFYTTLLL